MENANKPLEEYTIVELKAAIYDRQELLKNAKEEIEVLKQVLTQKLITPPPPQNNEDNSD